MKRVRWWMVVFWMLAGMSAGAMYAQEEPELPPVLTATDVFTDAVQIIERMPEFEIDNTQGLAYYFDPVMENWSVIPYPAELAEIQGVVARSDGTTIVGPDVTDGIQWELRQDVKWLFDPAVRDFVRPAMTCRRVADLPGEGTWRVIYDPVIAAHRLCHTETDERLDALPAEIDLALDGYAGAMSIPAWLSPDGERVIFSNRRQDMTFYSYHLATEEVLTSGTVTLNDIVSIDAVAWSGDMLTVKVVGTWQFPGTRWLQMDVTKEESLQELDESTIATPVPAQEDEGITVYEQDGVYRVEGIVDGVDVSGQLPNAPFGQHNGARILIWTDTPTFTWGVTLYDALTRTQTPIIHSLDWDPYIVYTEWVDSDQLRVEVVSKEWSFRGNRDEDLFTVGTWIIQIP